MGPAKLGFWFVSVIAILLMVINLPTLGLPGYYEFLVGSQLPMCFLDRLNGDFYQDIAVNLGLIWPPFIPVAYWLASRIAVPKWMTSFAQLFRVFVFFGLIYIWLVLLCTAFQISKLNIQNRVRKKFRMSGQYTGNISLNASRTRG
jgi:hypothetical protein